jgi:predicted DNA-binding transcriptional regulator AlpA
VREAQLEELPALAGRLREAELVAELRLRNAQPTNGTHSGGAGEDRNLSAKEAALRLGLSIPYLYKHADEYPFARRIGKRVLFSALGLDAWNRGQRPGLTAGSLEG